MAEITAKGGPLMAGPTQQILPDTWANQVWWPNTKTALPDVLYTRAQTDALLKGKRPNITGTYPVATGQTIAAGDVVDVVEGKVQRTVAPVGNVEKIFVASQPVDNTCVLNLNQDYSIAMVHYPNYNNNNIEAYLISNDDGAITATTGIGSASSSAANLYISLARLSDTKFVVGYVVSGILYANVGVVNGTNVTYGSRYTVSGVGTNYNRIIPLSETSFIAIYNRSGLKGKVCTVSGTTITQGTETALSGSTNAAHISATLLPDLNGSKRVCVCFSDGNDGNKGKAVIATIDSNNAVTWGTVVTFENNATTAKSICAYDNGVVIAYVRSGVGIFISKCAISGAAISPAASSLLTESYGASPALLNIGGKIVMVSAPVTPVSGYAAVLKPSGSTFALGDRYQFTTAGYPNYASLDVISDGRFIVSYARSSDLYGTATILTVYGDQIAGSFIDESSQAIALQSGTAGESIEVIFDGVAELAGLSAGREITSAGVYGYCPMDGCLAVVPFWERAANLQVASGSYTGTGAYGSDAQNSLVFPFDPNLILISGGGYFAVITTKSSDIRFFLFSAGSTPTTNALIVAGNIVSWWGGNAMSQMNVLDKKYTFNAFR